MEKKIKVVNTSTSRVSVVDPNSNFRHEWQQQGAFFMIPQDVLEQLLFDPGVQYMFDTGILYIEDMQAKQELGLEPEDADKPVNIIVLTDKERRYYMVNLPLEEFKTKVDALNHEQQIQLAEYAIAHRLADFEKAEYLKEKTGRDIYQAIRLSDKNKEE